MTFLKNKPLVLGIGAIGVAVVAWLAFGFFGIQSAFIDNEVSEAGPVFAADNSLDIEGTPDTQASTDSPDPDEGRSEDSDSNPDDETSEPADEPAPAEIVTLVSGDFAGLSRYDVTGTASVLNDGSEQRFLRFENFESTNGPDLKVYLRSASGEFVNLGELKGNIGDQNYEIPTDVDLADFSTVEIWCERFSVGFGTAALV